jgi:hypothetical protein
VVEMHSCLLLLFAATLVDCHWTDHYRYRNRNENKGRF